MNAHAAAAVGHEDGWSATAKTDFWLLASVGFLLTLGLLFIYSSSAVHALKVYEDGAHFVRSQMVRGLIGVVGAYLLYRTPTETLQRRAGWLYLAAVVLCIAVLVPGVGVVRNGARRWMSLGPIVFQPSEMAKLGIIISLAAVLARREARRLKRRPSLLIPVLVAQLPVALILAESDLGTALVIELILAVMVFVAGVRVRTLVALGLAALPVFYHLIVSTPFRLRRLLAYVDPWAYRDTVGYQLSEALISLGSGGLLGVGLGEGKHGLFFLPEAHTDFIFASLGQEMGLLGVSGLLLAFGILLWRSARITCSAGNAFERYLALGLTAMVGIPAVFNTCVVTGLLPTKGLPLPLVSYGGSNLIVTLMAVGLLLRIHRQNAASQEDAE